MTLVNMIKLAMSFPVPRLLDHRKRCTKDHRYDSRREL